MLGREFVHSQGFQFVDEVGERAEPGIAFEQHRHGSTAAPEFVQQGYDGRGDGGGMRIEVKAVVPGPASDVDHRDAVEGKRGQDLRGVMAVVDGVGPQVAEVEQQVAVGGGDDFVIECGFVEVVVGPVEGAGDVFEEQRNIGEMAAGGGHIAGDDGDGGPGPRQRSQVADLPVAAADEGHVFGDHRGTQGFGDGAQLFGAIDIDAVSTAQRQLDAVDRDRPHVGQRGQLVALTGVDHTRLGYDFDEVDHSRGCEQITSEFGSPAESNPREPRHHHRGAYHPRRICSVGRMRPVSLSENGHESAVHSATACWLLAPAIAEPSRCSSR